MYKKKERFYFKDVAINIEVQQMSDVTKDSIYASVKVNR